MMSAEPRNPPFPSPVLPEKYASRSGIWGLVLVLLALHVGLSNSGTWNKCSTHDEPLHIGNGVSFWDTGDYRMVPYGISAYRWMTLPTYLGGHKIPTPDGEVWRQARNLAYARSFMFDSGNDAQAILHRARLMISVLSAVLGLLVFVWARELFGTPGGVVSLTLYVFNPTVLANASSATLDMGASLAFTAALWTLWRVLHRLTPAHLAISGLVWGGALTAKYSTLLLLPMALIVVVVRLACARPWVIRLGAWREEVTNRGRMLALVALVALVHVAVSIFVIWLMFGFRFTMHRRLLGGWLDPAAIQFSDQLAKVGNSAAVIDLLHRWRLLPEAYLFGLCETMKIVVGKYSFLNGRVGTFGFLSFFPYCLFYKTPFAVFLVGAAGIAAYVVRRVHAMRLFGRQALSPCVSSAYAATPLWCILVVYGYTAITSEMNIGIRHILPIFPAVFILMGSAGLWMPTVSPRAGKTVAPAPHRETGDGDPRDGDPRTLLSPTVRKGAAWGIAICLAWLVIEVASVYPNYLAYFNFIGGGSDNGYRHLVDSSLDWGQELPSLKMWLDKVNGSPDRPNRIYLSYFGSTPPSAFDINATLLPGFFNREFLEPRQRWSFEPSLSAGTYVISATMLQSVYNPIALGPWRKDYEWEYQQAKQALDMVFQSGTARRHELIDRYGAKQWAEAVSSFEWLRLARLCAYLRHQKPFTTINHGLLVYTVTQADLHAALDGKPAEQYDPPTIPGGNVPY